jgi:cytochrome P450
VSLPPGPRAPPAYQLLQFTLRPLEYFEECGARFGDPFTARLAGLGTYVSLSAPELIKQVFTGDPEQLLAGAANAVLEPMVGRNSVLLLDGLPHQRQRKLLMPPLHGERMRAYAQVMAETTVAELKRMPSGRAFSLHAHMQAITLDVILRTVFGLSAGPEMEALRAALVDFLVLPPAIVTFIPPRYLDFPLSPYRTFVKKRTAVHAQLDAVVRARRAAKDEGRTDVLSLLLAARDDAGQPMTDEELRDELITMLLAGHETTATSLSWAFALLLGHPQVLERLQAEVEGARLGDGSLDVSAVPKLEYTDAVIKEALRLRPILPDVVRKLTKPTRIAGYDIPAGVNLMPTIYLAHRRAETYPEPEAFKPERFIGAKIDSNAWLPFGGGVRRCLGMAFALYEMKIVLAQTLLHVKLKLASEKPPKVVRRAITLAPKGGTPVLLQERRAA